MSDASTLVPTWGYRPDGSAQIFELEAGAALPDGWHPTPDCIEDRSLATAEALTEAAARAAKAAERRPAPTAAMPVAVITVPAPALAEENARLRAENAGLIADLAEVRERLAAADDEKAHALERVASLSADLDRARTAASTPPGPIDGPAPEPAPQNGEAPAKPVQSGQPARTRAEAREAVLVLLGEDLTDREIARRVGVSPSTVASIRKSQP